MTAEFTVGRARGSVNGPKVPIRSSRSMLSSCDLPQSSRSPGKRVRKATIPGHERRGYRHGVGDHNGCRGGAILAALRGKTRGPDGTQARATGSAPPLEGDPRQRALERWRHGVAVALGVPEYVVLRNTALTAIATSDVRDGRALAALPGLGPRTLAKHGEALLRVIAAHPPDHYLLPVDQGGHRRDAGR
jgi:superfamily II DNA helicase RecQ